MQTMDKEQIDKQMNRENKKKESQNGLRRKNVSWMNMVKEKLF